MKRIAGFVLALLVALTAVTLGSARGCWAVQGRASPAQWAPPTAYSDSRFWWTVLSLGAIGVIGALAVLILARRRWKSVLVITAAALWAAAVMLWARSDASHAVSLGWSRGPVGVSGVGIDGTIVRTDV